MSNIEYLRKFSNNVKFIGSEEIDQYTKDIQPEWENILQTPGFEKKLEKVLAHWQNYLESELSNTITYMESNCIGLDFISIDDRISVIYTIKGKNENVLYYEGVIPRKLTASETSFLSSAVNNLDLFYSHIHNGFYYYAGESMGISRLDSIIKLSDLEWGILEELEAPVRLNFETTFGFFSNGMGTYVCVDVENGQCVLWSAKRKPSYDLKFWDVIDEWIVIGFTA